MATYLVPTAESLNAMLGMIVGDAMQATADDAAASLAASHAAVFENADKQVVALCRCDISAAAALGSALSMIPPNVAADMSKSGSLNDMATDNLYEVMNMFSSLFMDDKSAHLKLTQVVPATDAPTIEGETSVASFTIPPGKYPGGALNFSTL
ncbi:MAG: hypothetical protein AB8G17_00955 [Gammaproteobacteria bacterium]